MTDPITRRGQEMEARYGSQIDDLYEEELRALRAEGSTRKPPKPTGNVCTSCAPIVEKWMSPSGRLVPRLRHTKDCDVAPLKLIPATAYVQGRSWPPGRWRR